MQECYRLLAPGGMMIHAEAPLYRDMDIYTAFIYDWETANNNEPFWSGMRELDLVEVAAEAGFETDKISRIFVPNGVWKAKASTSSNQSGGFSSRGTWFALKATK